MAKKGSSDTIEVSPGLIRSEDQIQIFDKKAVKDTVERFSGEVECRAFREFLLYLAIDSTGSPTTLRVKLEYLDRWSGKWHTYKQGLFASLFYEDGDTASGVYECFSGSVMGRQIRITLTGVGTTGSAYFTVSATLEFRN